MIGDMIEWALRRVVYARGRRATAGTPQAAAAVTLVMLSVNPDTGEDGHQLEVENERARVIRARDGSKHQGRVRIEVLPDADFVGLAKSLRLHMPTMLHVTGHGRRDGSIVLRDEQGQAYPMNPEGLAELFAVHRSTLRLVVLNACYSQELAEQLAPDIDCVVGMTSEIDDDAAILFSESFYEALFDGASVGDSFRTGVAALRARHTVEADYPCLRHRDTVDPDRVRIV